MVLYSIQYISIVNQRKSSFRLPKETFGLTKASEIWDLDFVIILDTH